MTPDALIISPRGWIEALLKLRNVTKNIGEIFVIQFYECLKELFDFNKLTKLIYMIILE